MNTLCRDYNSHMLVESENNFLATVGAYFKSIASAYTSAIYFS